MQKIKNLFLIVVLLMSSIILFGQNEHDHYLQTAVIRLLEGKCEKAGANYNVYKEMTGKTDLEFEGMIKDCKEGVPTKITGQIDTVRVEYDVYKNNEKGVKIYVSFHTRNMLHVNGVVIAHFDGDVLKGRHRHPETGDRRIESAESFKPSYRASRYEGFELFMPYDEFDLPSGKHDLKFEIIIAEYSVEKGIVIAMSENLYITYTKP